MHDTTVTHLQRGQTTLRYRIWEDRPLQIWTLILVAVISANLLLFSSCVSSLGAVHIRAYFAQSNGCRDTDLLDLTYCMR